MLLKPFVITGLCVCLLLGISGTANAIKMKKSAAKPEHVSKTVELNALVERVLSEHPSVVMAQVDIDLAIARVQSHLKLKYESLFEDDVESEADLLLQAAKANMAQVKEEVAAELVSVMVRYLSGRDMNVAAKKRIQLLTQFVNVLKSREIIDKSDVDATQSVIYSAELLLADAHIRYAQISASLIRTLGDFRALTGASVDPSMPFPAKLPKSISKNINIGLLVVQHPLVTAAKLKVKAIKTHIRISSLAATNKKFNIGSGVRDDDYFMDLHFVIPAQAQNNIHDNVSTKVPEIGHTLVKDEQHAIDVYRQVLGNIEASKGQYIVLSRSWKMWNSFSGKRKLHYQLESLEKI